VEAGADHSLAQRELGRVVGDLERDVVHDAGALRAAHEASDRAHVDDAARSARRRP
jgi:hypothetical protein